MDGDLAFADFIERVRSLSDMPEEVAREVAPELQRIAIANAQAGTDPTTGAAWAPRKKDGERAYPNPAKYIVGEASGSVVTLRVRFPYSIGNFAMAKRMPLRRMIPAPGDKIPAAYVQAFEKAAEKVFARKMEGR